MIPEILSHFDDHFAQLKTEIEAYPSEKDLWKTAPGISNSAGNLVCHLIGNLNHFIGHALGDTGYKRDRPLEFSAKDIPRKKLVQDLDSTLKMMHQIVPGLDLQADYPPKYFGKAGSVGYFLLKMLGHFNYHMGQINYHHRILTS